MQQKKDQNITALLWLVLGVLGRLLPHPANVTPLTSASLFGGTQLPRWKAFSLTIATLVASDLLLSRTLGYPAFGAWSLFTYSGFAGVILAGTRLRKNASAGRTAGFLVSASLGFWLWTNFGTWLLEGLYPHTASGLGACYTAALPFLRNALLGDLVWGAAFFASFALARKQAARFGVAVEGA